MSNQKSPSDARRIVLTTLRKRADHLEKRTIGAPHLAFDRGELSALKSAIAHLESCESWRSELPAAWKGTARRLADAPDGEDRWMADHEDSGNAQ